MNEVDRTTELFKQLLAQLHNDNAVLVGLIQTYVTNVKHLTDLATKLIEAKERNVPDK
jgi:hypothetical protein